MDWLTEAINASAAAAPDWKPAPAAQKGRVVHVDGDYLAYFCAGGNEMPAGTARRVTAERIDNFREMAGAERAIVHLTSAGSTKGERFLAATVKPYQGQRGGSKPKNWRALREYLETAEHTRFVRKMWDDREADDGCSLASAQSTDPENLVALGYKDKDFRMIPGRHIDWDTYTETVVPRGTYELLSDVLQDDDGKPLMFGTKWFWVQMLMGDGADNIPGLPILNGIKCGKARAKAALAGTTCDREAMGIVAKGYADHYGPGWSDRMAEQASLLWMRVGETAPVDDFLHILPLHKAASRLTHRIATERARLNGYQTAD